MGRCERFMKDSTISILRALAFLFVLLGHSFPDSAYEFISPITRVAHDGIYSFHMPLFFIISGYCMTHILIQDEVSVKSEVKKRAYRLLVPYFVYSVIAIAPKLILAPLMYREFDASMIWKIFIGNSPSGTLWYIYTLFFVSVFFILLSSVIKLPLIWFIISIAAYVLYILVPILHNNFFKYSIFFMGGGISLRLLDKDYFGTSRKDMALPVAVHTNFCFDVL